MLEALALWRFEAKTSRFPAGTFSDQTLEGFASYDPETYRQIVGHFAYWDDIEIHFRGTTHRIGGNGFWLQVLAPLLTPGQAS